jgi:hypothetical protein
MRTGISTGQHLRRRPHRSLSARPAATLPAPTASINRTWASTSSFRFGSERIPKLEFRSEIFNLLNKTNFRAPASSISSANFGTITSTAPARQIQFALKLLF